MNKKFKKTINGLIFENGSYKIVALCVSLVLWITILGRKDIVLSHEVEMQFLLAPKHVITNKVPKTVEIKLVGPRMGLKKFVKNDEIITIDLVSFNPGYRVIKINKNGLNLPLGVKVVSIKPSNLKVNIKLNESGDDNE